jgi:hypothetical protein
MRLIPGDELPPTALREVLASFSRRHLSGMRDADWLACHAFWIAGNGSRRRPYALARNRRFAEPYYRPAWPFRTAPDVLLEI